MIEYFLQHSEIFCLFIEPIAEGFAHGVSPNRFDLQQNLWLFEIFDKPRFY